jgi:hypothetical protein
MPLTAAATNPTRPVGIGAFVAQLLVSAATVNSASGSDGADSESSWQAERVSSITAYHAAAVLAWRNGWGRQRGMRGMRWSSCRRLWRGVAGFNQVARYRCCLTSLSSNSQSGRSWGCGSAPASSGRRPSATPTAGSSSTSSGSEIGCSGWVSRGLLSLGRTLRVRMRRPRKSPTRPKSRQARGFLRAGDRTRTGDVQLGKLAFYH